MPGESATPKRSVTVPGKRSVAVVPGEMMIGFAVSLTVRTVWAARLTPPRVSDAAT